MSRQKIVIKWFFFAHFNEPVQKQFLYIYFILVLIFWWHQPPDRKPACNQEAGSVKFIQQQVMLGATGVLIADLLVLSVAK